VSCSSFRTAGRVREWTTEGEDLLISGASRISAGLFSCFMTDLPLAKVCWCGFPMKGTGQIRVILLR